MTFGNHVLSGIVLIEIYFAGTGELWSPSLIFEKNRFAINGMIFCGLMAGSIFPDVDLKLNLPRMHRTVTHWPYGYYIILIIMIFAEKVWGIHRENLPIICFCLGAQVHILLDLMTPMGVPLGWNPFGKRFSLYWFKVGSEKEKVFSAGLVLLGFVIYLL